MNKSFATTLFFLLLLLGAARLSADPIRYAVIVGNNSGLDRSRTLRYAEQDARKIYQTLSEVGGFAPADMELLLGRSASAVTSALKAIEKRAQEERRRTGRQTMLVFYYSGHAEGDRLETGNSTLPFSQLRAFLEKSAFDIRIAFVDSCMSGRLINLKGGAPAPSFDLQVTDRLQSTGYAIITSSTGNQLSQESRSLRGSYFTHFLVSALRGAGDTTRDGQVSLQEAYRYAYAKTVAMTTTTIGGTQHPMYHFRLEGQGDLVLTRPGNFTSAIRVSMPTPARILILDGSGENILIETAVSAHTPLTIPAGPGAYHLFALHADGRITETSVQLSSGETRSIAEEEFRLAKLERTTARGGLFSQAETEREHQITLAAVLRRFPLEGGSLSAGAAASWRLIIDEQIQPVVRLNWTAAPDAGVSKEYFDLGAMAGIGWIVPAAALRIRLEVLAGYEHMFQAPAEGQSRHTSGFAYLFSTGFELPLGNALVGMDAGAGGRIFQVIDKGWVHRIDFQAMFFMGYRWGFE